MKIEIDLGAAIAATLAPEKLQPVLEKALGAAVKQAIEDATGYRSAFRETLTEQLKAAIPHGLELDDLAKFQLVLNQAMSTSLRDFNNESVQAAIKSITTSVFPEMPTTIKLSKLMELAREGFHKERDDSFHAELRETSYGYRHLTLSGNKPSTFSQPTHELSITDEGEVYALRMNGQQLMPTSVPTVISEWDSVLIALYTGRTRLDLDIDADEVEAMAQPQHD